MSVIRPFKPRWGLYIMISASHIELFDSTAIFKRPGMLAVVWLAFASAFNVDKSKSLAVVHNPGILASCGTSLPTSADTYTGCSWSKQSNRVDMVSGTLSLTSCTFTNCQPSSSSSNGGAVYCSGTSIVNIATSEFIGCYAKQGGAVFVDTDGEVTITDTKFRYCAGTSRGGSVYSSSMVFVYKDCEMDSSSSTGYFGGGLAIHGSSQGTERHNKPSVTISSSSFTNCSVGSGSSGGGGMIIETGTVEISYCYFYMCYSKSWGGGLTLAPNTGYCFVYHVTVTQCSFKECKAKQAGGGLYVDSRAGEYTEPVTGALSYIELIDCTKESTDEGSVIYVTGTEGTWTWDHMCIQNTPETTQEPLIKLSGSIGIPAAGSYEEGCGEISTEPPGAEPQEPTPSNLFTIELITRKDRKIQHVQLSLFAFYVEA